MQAYRISTESIDEGLDRRELMVLKQRFLQVNKQRLARTRSALAQRQQIFLDLLPLLFHCNHPMLPGYVSHQTPAGVADFTPDKEDVRLAQSLARSFCLSVDPHQARTILALYLMGSVGTVAHSDSSDLDIWVCYEPGLGAAQLAELENKCTNISQWAAELGLEAHFFLMDCQRFQHGEVAFNSEASGSAQHYLLLDEFYRTALLIAGRAPLWWFSPAAREEDYGHYTHILLSRRFMSAADVLDFGGIARIPDGEFVGAGVWQLYKGIESPYKSVLKLMLLECYVSEYPGIVPLSLSFKEAIYNGQLDVNELDPYVMIYRRLEAYLTQRREAKRLELLRRCFYFKIDKPLTKAPASRQKSWQQLLLENLVEEWGWSREYLALLDARPHWKAQRVIAERKLLVSELTNSYRFLVDFARQTHSTVTISPDELNILGRKLHAAFERKAGKIEWINPCISPDLSEPSLTLVEETHAATGKTSWAAYAQPPAEPQLQTAGLIKKSRNLVELLVWCHGNGILTRQTRCEHVVNTASLPAQALRHTVQAIQRWLPLPLPAVAHESFQQPARVLSVLLLINVAADPDHRMRQKGVHRLSNHTDPLGYSAMRENLVVTIDMVTRNSWNEVSTLHFANHALLNCLLHYLRIAPPDDGRPLPPLSVRCLSLNRAVAISQRVEELLRDIVACYYGGTQPAGTRYLFEMGNNCYCLQFHNRQPHINQLPDEPRLLEHLGQPQPHYSPIVVDRYALRGHPLRVIADTATDTAIQIFYWPQNSGEADVYVVDEKGSVLKMRMPFLDPPTLLRPLHRFIRAVIDRQSVETDFLQQGFGIYPVHFYELKANAQGITHGERRSVNTEVNRLFFFNVQAIAENTYGGEPSYRIYCDQQEFTELEYGEELFAVVARYILSRRRNAERYPCYITDLDLSQCRTRLAPQSSLQIIDYLRIKAQLEEKLNAALQKA